MPAILVTGDFLIDHHLYEGRRRHFGDQRSRGVCVQEELGGAALIHRLLEEIRKRTNAPWRSVQAVDEAAALATYQNCSGGAAGCVDQPFAAFAFWKPYGPEKEKVWRVAESMGYGGGAAAQDDWPWKPNPELPAAPEIVVISDGGMGFRSRMHLGRWGIPIGDRRLPELRAARLASAEVGDRPTALPETEPRWIVLKMAAPVGEGDLWRELVSYHAERLVVVVSASELRRAGVRLSLGLSWEQTLEDLHQALKTHAGLQQLARARHVIVVFDNEAALWLHRTDGAREAVFLFDPSAIEGDLRQGVDGQVYGATSCLTAAVAAQIAANGDHPDLERGIHRGIAAMRRLLRGGHGDAACGGAGFPAARLAELLHDGAPPIGLQSRSFPCEGPACPVRPGWSLLALHEAPAASGPVAPLFGIARRVLVQGARTLQAPTYRVGDFFTADRGEIEALRSLRQLVERYLADRKADKPLSIGVFGPPGAGKSFAVRELAKQLLKDRLGWLEFNLSQFNGPTDLIGALHQVRDKFLEGKTPVAFFDEFDSQDLAWLKYLLAPMQDGRFQEGQISHPVGQCLFIFAGGTSHSFEEFAARKEGAGTAEHAAADHFVSCKGPDFASRLDGRLNVVGPNPREATAGARDVCYPVRRALFVRSRLKCDDAERLKIHPGLATALLQLEKFEHGSRSLTKLLEPFRQLRRTDPTVAFNASLLPPRDQLELLLNPNEFEELIRRDDETADQLGVDHLAAAVHGFYRAKGTAEKWIKPHHDCEFRDLPPFDQASNRAAARRIPANLALAGLRLEPGTPTAEESERAAARIRFHLDLLAEAEHDGWVEWHLDNGWSQAEVRDDARQRHDLLIPYADLPEKQRDKDRDVLRNYPKIAELAGLKIVPYAS